MNWDALGATGELIGALAVVLTVLYLATQIRQGRTSLNMSSVTTIIERNSATAMNIASNEELLRVMAKAIKGDPLSREESLAFNFVMVASVNLLYEAWILRSAGIMPDEMWEPQLKNTIDGFRYPAGRHWLEMDSLSYDQEFIRFLRDEVKKDDGSSSDGQ